VGLEGIKEGKRKTNVEVEGVRTIKIKNKREPYSFPIKAGEEGTSLTIIIHRWSGGEYESDKEREVCPWGIFVNA